MDKPRETQIAIVVSELFQTLVAEANKIGPAAPVAILIAASLKETTRLFAEKLKADGYDLESTLAHADEVAPAMGQAVWDALSKELAKGGGKT